MNKLFPALVFLTVTLVAVAIAAPLDAQQKRISPHESIYTKIDGNLITVVYGRPFAKDRKIWGGLVPYGKVWRTGSDEHTLLITQRPLTMGSETIPAGAYSLYTIPEEKGSSKLIINKQLGQWGLTYDAKQDVARVDMQRGEIASPVDQFTMAIEKGKGKSEGVLKMMWEKTQFSVPFTVVKK